MTAVKYVRRPHRTEDQCFEYTRASRDEWLPWAHVVLFLALIAALYIAVQFAGGSFDLP